MGICVECEWCEIKRSCFNENISHWCCYPRPEFRNHITGEIISKQERCETYNQKGQCRFYKDKEPEGMVRYNGSK